MKGNYGCIKEIVEEFELKVKTFNKECVSVIRRALDAFESNNYRLSSIITETEDSAK